MASFTKHHLKNGESRFRARITLKSVPARVKTFAKLSDAKFWSKKTEYDLMLSRDLPEKLAMTKTVNDMICEYSKTVKREKINIKEYNRAKEIRLNWWANKIGDVIWAS